MPLPPKHPATFASPYALTDIGRCQSLPQCVITKLLRALHELQCQDVVGKIEGDHLSCAIGTKQHILRIQVLLKETGRDHITCRQMHKNVRINTCPYAADGGVSALFAVPHYQVPSLVRLLSQ